MLNSCNQSALIVAKSESIVRLLNRVYPALSQLFVYDREGTIGFLEANGGLYGFSSSHNFHVPHSGNNSYKSWSDYRDAIERYLEIFCESVKTNDPGEIFQGRIKTSKKCII